MLATQLALVPMRRAGGGAIVNVASTAGLGSEPYQSPEYGAAKAGLIRFTSALGALDGVRVNCIVPDWVATERVTAQERATTPPPIPLATVAGAVIRLIRDDTLAGRALVLWRGESRAWTDAIPDRAFAEPRDWRTVATTDSPGFRLEAADWRLFL